MLEQLKKLEEHNPDLALKIRKEGNNKKFYYKNYLCEIIRTDFSGSLNGYVYIPSFHELYEKSLIEDKIFYVHGGLTYSESFDEYRIIGFDCGHSGDVSPFLVYMFEQRLYDRSATYRDMKYVELQIKSLIDQIEQKLPNSMKFLRRKYLIDSIIKK